MLRTRNATIPAVEEQPETKDDIRRRMRTIRRALAPEERVRASKVICAKLINDDLISVAVDPFEGGGAVAVYLASPDEIDLSEFILEMLDLGVKVVAPRWNGETYELAKLKSLSESGLRRGPMNILEPAEAEIVKPSEVAVWIVPGLAFTIMGDRLGYGGGWYDRLMAGVKGSFKIGVAYEFQIVKNLPHEQHDIPLIRIVTDDLSDRHVEFTETEDGFRASVSIGAQTMRRVLFILSLLGICLFPFMLRFAVGFTHGKIAMPMWAWLTALVAMAVAILASAIALLYILGGPETAEIEVKGEEGVCRRRFLGLIPHRTIRFRWSPWSKARPYGYSFYSAPRNTMLSIVEGSVERCLFRTYSQTSLELSIRMNLSHRIDQSQETTSAEAILAVLPRGMRIIRDGDSETMEAKVHSLTGLGSALGCCGLLGLVASTVFLWLSDWTISLSATAPLLNWLSALSVVFIALVPIVWTVLFLAVGYHALWTLFGRHRLTVTGANCEYEARLGPRVKRKSFVLSGGSHATSYPGNSLCVTAADGEHHYCFDNLPPRCYLPLTVFVRKHALRLT